MREAALGAGLSDTVGMKGFVVDKNHILAVAVYNPAARNECLCHKRIEESNRWMSAVVLVVHHKESNLDLREPHNLPEADLELLS